MITIRLKYGDGRENLLCPDDVVIAGAMMSALFTRFPDTLFDPEVMIGDLMKGSPITYVLRTDVPMPEDMKP